MPNTQRVAQYIQRLAYETLLAHDQDDERPEDAQPSARGSSPDYPMWNASSFPVYVPFRSSRSG
jgi:hypothetical protein